jgi:hypothetical protein
VKPASEQRGRSVPIHPLDAQHSDALFDFLDTRASPRGRRHWQWKYVGQGSTAPCGFYWDDPDGRVLGFIGLMRTSLHTGDRQYDAAWFVDWHVVPGDRGVGVGLGLLRKAEVEAGVLLTLQGSADTRQILPRLGWKQSTAPHTFVLPLSAGFLAATVARRVPAWLRGVARASGVAVPYFRVAGQPTSTSAQLIATDRFPATYDTVWRARSAEFAPTMRRDSAYLNYLCADFPDADYHLQLLQWRGETVGHLVWRIDTDRRTFRRGRIIDLLWPRSDAGLGQWLHHTACRQLQAAGADYIELATSLPESRDFARRQRFHRRDPVPIWYHRVPPEVPTPDAWHVTFLDCDRAYR